MDDFRWWHFADGVLAFTLILAFIGGIWCVIDKVMLWIGG